MNMRLTDLDKPLTLPRRPFGPPPYEPERGALLRVAIASRLAEQCSALRSGVECANSSENSRAEQKACGHANHVDFSHTCERRARSTKSTELSRFSAISAFCATVRFSKFVRLLAVCVVLCLLTRTAFAQGSDWRHTALKSRTPDNEIVRQDKDGDGKPDIIERWWNGKRVRWLDENGDMQPGDTRGDQVADVLQVDMDGDGNYDGLSDINVKWADTDGDGIPDVQAFVVQPDKWNDTMMPWAHGIWMVFQNFDKKGVLGWMDWQKFNFDCWGHTGKTDWLPNYGGHSVFLKIHSPVFALNDPRLNWENPFAFYDFDDDGAPEMAIRWLDPPKSEPGKIDLTGHFNEAFVTMDLDNDSGKDNETDYDMTLRGAGGPGVDYTDMKMPLPGFHGNPKFDSCFQHNNWRHIDEVFYMPVNKAYDAFFSTKWQTMYFVFDEDDDDHRWERVELYYPTVNANPDSKPADIYSTARWNNREKVVPGICGHSQADSLGDRGEFDMDNSGGGELYIGAFDRKLHLAGAEWGAWTVDRIGKFHAGALAAPPMPQASKVEEVVKYTDTDTNGFIDTIEYDYDGDRNVDFKVCLLDYKQAGRPAPDEAELIDTRHLGWKGMHELFNKMADDAWIEALEVYRAAWRRGLTTREIDKLAFAATKAERYDHAYWLKEEVFRLIRRHLAQLRKAKPSTGAESDSLEKDLTRTYYLGQFTECAKRIGDVPGQ